VTYTIDDGLNTDTSTLTINVTPQYDPPAAEDDGFSVEQSQSVSGNVITHDDGDGVIDTAESGSLTITQVNGVDLVFDPADDDYATVNVDGGVLRINEQGDFTYTNSLGYQQGSAYPSFAYTVSDGTDSDSANVTITINDSAPEANADNNYIYVSGNNDAGHRVRGNVITGGSSGDVADGNADSTELTSVDFAATGNLTAVKTSLGNAFRLDIMNNGEQIGTLIVLDDGFYVFQINEGVATSKIPEQLVFNYTIEENGELLPESDSTTLTINFSRPAGNSVNPPEVLSDSSLIDLSASQDSSIQKEQLISNDQNDVIYDDMLDDGSILSVEELLPQSESIEIIDDVNSDSGIELESLLTDESSSKPIENTLLKDGATMMSDSAVEASTLSLDLDSQEVI